MPIPFSDVCVLLSRLEDIELRDPPFLQAGEKFAHVKAVTHSWFKSHRRAINELDVQSSVALISALLPERRTDRVYGIQATRLCRILSRSLHLSATRTKDLKAYEQPGAGDLAACVERVLASSGPPALPSVSLNDVDDMLQTLAGMSVFSDSHIFKLPRGSGSSEIRDQVLSDIFKRVQPIEGKWLVRLILKDFSPVRINEGLVLKAFHFLLLDLLLFQNTFDGAIGLLKGRMSEYPECPDPRSERLFRQQARKLLKPVVGTKVGRPEFRKARSIDHCMNMLNGRRWVLERKYDGEYCEIHVDLSRSQKVSECITIFSKSGKDSTADREGLHEVLVESLRLGSPECRFKRQAIFLGELVVYSGQERRILPFEEIRKHVSRSGISLGIDLDSQPKTHEHLAIVFFDVLLLDDETVMNRPVDERRSLLRKAYTKIHGRAQGADWKIVDFADTERARKALIRQFAASISDRCEGLVLKPCGVPFFALGSDSKDHGLVDYIKLKKDYIQEMGDEADFAVVGANYNSQQALKSGVSNIKWTDFHLGCLVNKTEVLRFDARARFQIVGTIKQDACIPKPILQAANQLGQFCARPYEKNAHANFDLHSPQSWKMDVVFDHPFVFEVLGSGFEKPSNSNLFMLRHPRVKKLHQDRTWRDCVSLQELQEQAAVSRSAPADSESQETRRWIEKLERRCKKKLERQRTGTSTISSKKSDLDGTTLVTTDSPRLKRRREATHTPCPATKKQRVAIEDGDARAKTRSTGRGVPLAEITNVAPQLTTTTRDTEKPKGKTSSKNLLKKLSTLLHPEATEQTALKPSLQSRMDARRLCDSSKCHFSNTVVYLSPCIAKTPYIAENLLAQQHNVLIVPSLAHWDRDSFSHLPMTETVAESQAYEGMRKFVIVENKRVRAVRETVQQIVELNDGQWRERVEVWDWRVLEDCATHGFEAANELKRQHFLGATMFDEEAGGALFVSNVPWLAG